MIYFQIFFIYGSGLFSEIGDTFQIPVVQILGGGALYYRIFPEGFIAPIISTQAVDVTGITDNRIFQVKPAGLHLGRVILAGFVDD